MSGSSVMAAGIASLVQGLAHKLQDNPLKPIIVEIATDTSPNQVAKPDLEDDQKRWLVVGICLHSVISPALRQYIPPVVNKIYKSLVTKNQIDKQSFQNYMKRYQPTNKELNYEAINNNKSVPKVKGKKDVANYDYCVKNDVEFTKLFMQTNMAHYTGFDDTCDSSALLGMIINIDFPPNVKNVAEKLRSDVRNSWAHCNFSEWDVIQYQQSFQLMFQLIPNLNLPKADEIQIRGELTRWQTNGIQFLEGTTLGLELVQELKTETRALSKYLLEVISSTDECITDMSKGLQTIEFSFQQTLDKITNIEKQANEAKGEITVLQVDVNQIKKSHSDLSEACEETNLDLKHLQTEVTTTQNKLDVVQQTTNNIVTDMAGMKSDLNKKALDIEETKSEVLYSRTQIKDIKVAVEKSESEIEEIKTNTSKNYADLLQTKTEVSNIKTDIGKLSQNVFATKQLDSIFFFAPDKIPTFIARRDDMDQLQSGFENKCDRNHMQILCGLGGIGKTTLAIEYAWQFRSFYPAGVFWMSSESNEALEDSLERLAVDTDTMGKDIKETLHKVLRWISLLQDKWLLVIDNVDMDELHGAIKELVLGSWKRFSKGHIIITSRRKDSEAESDFHVKKEDCITLDVLSVSESKEFMILRSGQKSVQNDGSLDKLVEELEGLPLALEQAAAHIKALECSYKDYLEKFQKERLKFLKISKLPENVSKERRTVITTWKLNFKLIAKQSEEEGLGTAATTVMEIAAYLYADEIPLCIFNTGSPAVNDEDVLKCLQEKVGANQISEIFSRFSLFRGHAIQTLSVHRLVQEVIRENITDVVRQQLILECATRMVNMALESTPSPRDAIKEEEVGRASLLLWSKLALNANTVQKYVLKFAENHPDRASIFVNIETTMLLKASAVYHSLNQRQDEALACQAQMLSIVAAIDISDSTLRELTCVKIPLFNKERLKIQASMITNVSIPAIASKESNEYIDLPSSEALRESGNQEFKSQRYHKAIQCYSEALRVGNVVDPRVLSNRSLAYLKVCDYENALRDADRCIDSYKDKQLDGSAYKAFLWKAYAIAHLINLGQLPVCWKSVGLSAAAIAGHLHNPCLMEYTMKVEYPLVRFKVVENKEDLVRELSSLTNMAYTTLLLRSGRYDISGFPLISFKSVQLVGIEEGVEILSRYVVSLAMHNSSPLRVNYATEPQINILIENVCFPSGTEQIWIRDSVNATFYRCKFSNGKRACENYPRCQGGKGCVNQNPQGCKAIYLKVEKARQFPALGVVGFPGIVSEANGKVLVDNCILDRCGGGGILCLKECSVFEIKNSRIQNMRQMGIEAREGGKVIVDRCEIANNQSHGVAIGPKGKGIVTNCTIRGNWDEGIWCGGILETNCTQTTVSSSSNPEGGSTCIIKDNVICHNGYCGISLDGGCYEISGNKIFENWYWGIMLKSRSATRICRSDIFENKCGGIRIGYNYSAPVELDGNTIRDHTGPEIYIMGSSEDLNIFRPSKVTEFMKSAGMIEGEAGSYSLPPIITTRNVFQNNEKGQQHPTKELNLVQTCCYCHSLSNKLKKCAKCMKASYCSKNCQKAHWDRHKYKCEFLRKEYTVEIDMSKTEAVKENTYDRHSNERFIVQIQSGKEYTDDPNKYIRMHDERHKMDFFVRHPHMYYMVRECGVLTDTRFTQKKMYCWASFKDKGRVLCIHIDHLAPLQTW